MSLPTSRWSMADLPVAVQILDRVLDRDDVLEGGFVDVLDDRGERGRLPAAGRAGDQDDAALLLRQLADHIGHAEVAERANRIGDDPEDHRHAASLHVGVDAEAREVLDRVGEVELVMLLELLHARVGQHRVEHVHGVLRAERHRRVVEPAQLAVEPDQRAVSDLQAEVRATELDELHEESGDVEDS